MHTRTHTPLPLHPLFTVITQQQRQPPPLSNINELFVIALIPAACQPLLPALSAQSTFLSLTLFPSRSLLLLSVSCARN